MKNSPPPTPPHPPPTLDMSQLSQHRARTTLTPRKGSQFHRRTEVMRPWGPQRVPKGPPQTPQSDPRGPPGRPQETQGDPQGDPRGPKRDPTEPKTKKHQNGRRVAKVPTTKSAKNHQSPAAKKIPFSYRVFGLFRSKKRKRRRVTKSTCTKSATCAQS